MNVDQAQALFWRKRCGESKYGCAVVDMDGGAVRVVNNAGVRAQKQDATRIPIATAAVRHTFALQS